jgi:hypothetical protein
MSVGDISAMKAGIDLLDKIKNFLKNKNKFCQT